MKKNWLQIALVIALIAAAYYIGNLTAKVQMQNGTTKKVTLSTIKNLFKKDVIKLGSGKTKLLFVEISDPSCPYCHLASGKNPEMSSISGQFKTVAQGGSYVPPVGEIKKLVDEGKASLAYIYMPGHGNGELGVKAMYCANEKGKFWKVHDLLMSAKGYEILNGTTPDGQPTTGVVVKNDKTKTGDLANFLSPAIDAAFVKSCLDSGKYDKRLGTDTELAASLGVSGTPGFFVNDTYFGGAYSFTDMQSAVNAALK